MLGVWFPLRVSLFFNFLLASWWCASALFQRVLPTDIRQLVSSRRYRPTGPLNRTQWIGTVGSDNSPGSLPALKQDGNIIMMMEWLSRLWWSSPPDRPAQGPQVDTCSCILYIYLKQSVFWIKWHTKKSMAPSCECLFWERHKEAENREKRNTGEKKSLLFSQSVFLLPCLL